MANPARPAGSRPSSARLLPPRPILAAIFMLLFTALLYVVEFLDMFVGGQLDLEGGIVPRDPNELDGVLFAPLLHASWSHLEGNTLPFLLFGFLAMAGGFGQFLVVTAIIWLLGGLGVWLIAQDGSITIGASGVIFGWLVFLLARGFFARSGRQILLAGVLFFLWGGLLWSVLPGSPDVSWQAHLCGALAGMFAARVVAGADRRRAARAGHNPDAALPAPETAPPGSRPGSSPGSHWPPRATGTDFGDPTISR